MSMHHKTPSPKNERIISFSDALNEAMHQEMARDKSIFVYGIENKVFGSLDGLADKFGADRCFVTPLSEDAMTGFGLGAALNGMRPIHTHIRIDFLMLAMNQLVNMMSSYHYGTSGQLSVPLVIRAVVGRGWGQGFQHSKQLHGLFGQIPGLKVIMPTSPYDAKGLLISAIRDNNPVLFIEHRWLYWQNGHVPKESYQIEIGKPNVIRKGEDITIVATSWMNVEAAMAAEHCSLGGCDHEFTTNDYKIKTTPQKEWMYIVGDENGQRQECPESDMGHGRHLILIHECFQERKVIRAGLNRAEVIALVMYSGPMVCTCALCFFFC